MRGFLWLLVVAGSVIRGSFVVGQNTSEAPVVMLSDLHFDPLRDPAKAERLADASVDQWDRILKEPDSPEQAQEFAAVQQTCKSKKLDSDATLMDSALRNARKARPSFVTVTGDLVVHDFDCRYRAVFHRDEGYMQFAEKTAVYVIRKVDTTFPGVPVYLALGNNDSSCGDYRMERQDRFLAATGRAVSEGLRGASLAEVRRALETYEAGGYYSVALKGVARTRMVVLDDTFMSAKYKTCWAQANPAGEDAELAWLKAELAQARARGEKAWVIGHIPPGVDIYTTLKNAKETCTESKVTEFLEDNSIAEILEEYADVVRVALFAHTHADEMKLLRSGREGVAVKLVGSVSPINGNTPTFTVGQVDRRSGVLRDYTVFEASNSTGVAATWTKEYGFRETYRKSDFSAAAVGELIDRFRLKGNGTEEYQRYYAPGMSPVLEAVWPQYVCGMDQQTAKGYDACSCGGGK